jgi:hypothetical protein
LEGHVSQLLATPDVLIHHIGCNRSFHLRFLCLCGCRSEERQSREGKQSKYSFHTFSRFLHFTFFFFNNELHELHEFFIANAASGNE